MSSKPLHILLVDDQKSLRRSLSLMLLGAGFDTSEAESGSQALVILSQAEYDLVITDLRMDDMSGIDLLREIKQIKPHLPKNLITAYGSIESAGGAGRRGAGGGRAGPGGGRGGRGGGQASQ